MPGVHHVKCAMLPAYASRQDGLAIFPPQGAAQPVARDCCAARAPRPSPRGTEDICLSGLGLGDRLSSPRATAAPQRTSNDGYAGNMATVAWWMMGMRCAGARMVSLSLKILAASSARSWSFVTSCVRRRLAPDRRCSRPHGSKSRRLGELTTTRYGWHAQHARMLPWWAGCRGRP